MSCELHMIEAGIRHLDFLHVPNAHDPHTYIYIVVITGVV